MTQAHSRFQGTSRRGDHSEALRDAFRKAKIHLKTSLFRWKLVKTSGIYGGFAGKNDLTVTIDAKPGLPKPSSGRARVASPP